MRDAELHLRAKALFLRLVALPADARSSALEQEVRGDAALRAEVVSLLRHAGAPEPFHSAAAVVSAEQRAPRFSAGHVLAGRYRIVAELGRGATGEVYRAVDTRLDVEIAIKLVRHCTPQAIRRLTEEVRLARAITHPAVCRVYDVEEGDGEHFLTMELVQGDTLEALIARAGPLSAPRVREIGVELLRGLAAAHAHGILHRDLKPSNVLVDSSGSVRVTDFGIASYEAAADSSTFVGTPAFMAPEQLEQGGPASVKTDLYAVGLILYEALVGQLPEPQQGRFRNGERALPEPSSLLPAADAALTAVIVRLLAADPMERPATAGEAADALEGATSERLRHHGIHRKRASATFALLAAAMIAVCLAAVRFQWLGQRPLAEQIAEAIGRVEDRAEVGIAVLRLADESEHRDQGSLAREVQRSIIGRLEGLRDVRVIAETSTDRFGSSADIREAGHELGVSFIAAGRIKGPASDPNVELVLYDVDTGKRLWSRTYADEALVPVPRKIDDPFLGHLSALLKIEPAEAAAPPVPEVAATQSPATADMDAGTYTLYLRGREHIPPYKEAEFRSSVALLNQVIERPPQWAEPYAGIATAHVAACAFGWVAPAQGYPLARRYAEHALGLDPTLCEAHVALAIVAGEYDWDWAAAEASYRKASELCPGSAWVHRSRARFLSTQGRFEEALEETSKGLMLDPTSVVMLQGAAQRFYEARQYERAVALARIAKRMDPLFPLTYWTLGYALVEQGLYQEALAEFDRSMDVRGRNAIGEALRAYALARSGDQPSARRAAEEARRFGDLRAPERTLLALAENDPNEAVASLADAVALRAPPSIWLAVSPVLDPLRHREDFRALVARVGLESAARR